MESPCLTFWLDSCLSLQTKSSLRHLLNTLHRSRGVPVLDQSDKDPKDVDIATGVSVSSISSLGDFLDGICRALLAIGRPDESAAFQTVHELCATDEDHGGLGFQCDKEGWLANAKESSLQQVGRLAESWLESVTSSERAADPLPTWSEKPLETWPMTLAEKILAQHALSLPSNRGVQTGDLVRVSVDWIVASEISWVGMRHSMLKIGEEPTVWRNDRFWLAGDHTVDPRTYDVPRVRQLMESIEEAGRTFKMTENQGSNYTIIHTEFVRGRAEPGSLVLGSDSHTCSGGAVSSLAIGLGAADVMIGLATGETWFKAPASIRLEMIGEPDWHVRGKDIILFILQTLRRNQHTADRIVEIGGPGTRHLSIDARFAISNMCTELGAITGIFVPDLVTREYVSSRPQRRYRSHSTYFQPDSDANYAAKFEIDLSKVEPFVALYPSPDNVKPVSEMTGMHFDGCFIGACTTTEEDLVLAALVLEAGLQRGMSLVPGRRIVVPGSRPIVKTLESLGLMQIYIAAGFEAPAPSCSLCLGMGADKAGEGEHWISSQNRNFKNRMGQGAIGHICSAATVAASSFQMELTDPRELLQDVSRERFEELLEECQSSRVRRRGDHAAVEQSQTKLKQPRNRSIKAPISALEYMEPNLSPRSSSDDQIRAVSVNHGTNAAAHLGTRTPAFQRQISGRVYPLGDFIDTDAIISAIALMNSTTDEMLGSHCLEITNPDFRAQVAKGMNIVVAGEAFGCGSSREEAPRALKGVGVQCVIARSFSYIYGRNQFNIGLMGITITDDAFYAAASTLGAAIKIDLDVKIISVVVGSGGTLEFPFKLDAMELALIQSGGLSAAYKMHRRGVYRELCRIH